MIWHFGTLFIGMAGGIVVGYLLFADTMVITKIQKIHAPPKGCYDMTLDRVPHESEKYLAKEVQGWT